MSRHVRRHIPVAVNDMVILKDPPGTSADIRRAIIVEAPGSPEPRTVRGRFYLLYWIERRIKIIVDRGDFMARPRQSKKNPFQMPGHPMRPLAVE